MRNRKVHLQKEYPEMGKVVYYIAQAAKNVRITVKPPGFIEVTLPTVSMFKSAETFLLRKSDWVNKKLEHYKSKELRRTVFSPEIYFSTRSHRFVMKAEDRNNAQVKITEDEIIVRFPENLPTDDEWLQEVCRQAVIKALTIEAKLYLPERTLVLARKHGLNPQRISVRNNKTRWGSCSSSGNISLNIHLMRLPDDLIDYILLHELAHLVHQNHSKAFHDLLENMCPGHRALERRMKQYNPQLF